MSKLARTICGTMLAAAATAAYVSPGARAYAAPPEAAADKAETRIQWDVKPATVVIFLDDKKVGEAGSTPFTKTTPGRHTVRLLNGEDETEMDVSIKKGQTLKFTFEFED